MALRELGPQPREIPPEISKQIRRRGMVWFIIMLVSLPMGVVSLAVLYIIDDPFQRQRLEKDGIKAKGAVTGISLDRNIHSGSAHPWKISYKFETEKGAEVSGQVKTWDRELVKKHPEGALIDILYKRDNPLDNRPAAVQDRLIPWFIYVVFGLILLEGLIFLFIYRGVVAGARSLYVDGIASKGKIISIEEAKYINIGRRHPFNIRYSFRDPNTGREYEGFMRSYSFDLAETLKNGEEVTVVYDWENPARNMLVL